MSVVADARLLPPTDAAPVDGEAAPDEPEAEGVGPSAIVDRPTQSPLVERARGNGPRFAHASEAELARILDYYRVSWEYEPRAFPIMWNLEGQVVESFSPDFYLPDLDLWVELTTLRQSLVRRKNRKLRRMRELYPMVRIKLFYARDFRALMLKYGRLEVATAFIGTDGQVAPEAELAGSGLVSPSPGAGSSAVGEPSDP